MTYPNIRNGPPDSVAAVCRSLYSPQVTGESWSSFRSAGGEVD